MGSLTDAWEEVALDLIFGPTTRGASASVTVPTDLYVALFTTLPADDGTGGVEVSTVSTGYARVDVANTASAWPAAVTSSGTTSKSNAAAVTFPVATSNWGTVVGWGIFTAASAGTLIVYGSISPTVAVNSGNLPSFAAGALTVTCD